MSVCGCCFGLGQGTGYCDACSGFSVALAALQERHRLELLELEAEHYQHHRSRSMESPRDWTLLELLAPCDCQDCAECRERLARRAAPATSRWVLAKHPELTFIVTSTDWLELFRKRRDIAEAWFPQISDLALDEVLR